VTIAPDPFALAADALDPPDVDVFGALGYVPEPPQALFHEATEFDVGYGGRAGGGKSLALLMDGIRDCVVHPGMRVGAFRRSFDELDESLLMHLKSRLEQIEALGAKFVSTPYPELRFANSSIMRFRYAETMADASRRYGGEYQKLLIDERQQIAPPVVDLLTTRLRSGNPSLPVLGIRSTFNPGDVGHLHLKERYVLATSMGERVYDEVVAEKRTGKAIRFIPAPLSKHVDAGYVGVLQGIPDPQLRRALLEGDWDALAGQAFEDWRYDLHVIPAESCAVPIGAGVARAQGIDYGIDAPFVCLWGAIVADQIVVYREVDGRQLTPTQQAEIMLAAEAEGERAPGRPLRAALDPSAFEGYPDSPRPTRPDMPPPKSIASDYAAAGVPVHKAFNSRLSGKRLIHEALRPRADGTAGLVISTACPNLIRTLPALMRDPNNPEDVKKWRGELGSDGRWQGGDHWYDALRYLVAELRGKSPAAAQTYRRPNPRPRPATAGVDRAGF
jgi:hypothetical protein